MGIEVANVQPRVDRIGSPNAELRLTPNLASLCDGDEVLAFVGGDFPVCGDDHPVARRVVLRRDFVPVRGLEGEPDYSERIEISTDFDRTVYFGVSTTIP